MNLEAFYIKILFMVQRRQIDDAYELRLVLLELNND